MKAFLFLSAVLVLVSAVAASSFIPNQDIMTYGVDGELITIWGEHNFYTDTSSFGGVLTYDNGRVYIGSSYASTT